MTRQSETGFDGIIVRRDFNDDMGLVGDVRDFVKVHGAVLIMVVEHDGTGFNCAAKSA
ncbi:MAG: hypothetical protein ABFS24_04070 [Pseudomonadota bacterium]